MRGVFAALALAIALTGSMPALAACLLPGSGLPEADKDRYTADPGMLLGRHPRGGVGLAFDVRSLAADPARHRAILAMIRQSNEPQAQSIGEGLGRAASACQRLDAETARRIESTIRLTSNRTVERAYRNMLGEGPGSVSPNAAQSAGNPGEPIFKAPGEQRPFSTTLSGQQPGRGVPGVESLNRAPERKGFDLSDPFAPVELRK